MLLANNKMLLSFECVGYSHPRFHGEEEGGQIDKAERTSSDFKKKPGVL
jgi:hypothetical protein